jgi:putative ABC transport system permease protein
MIRLWRWLCLRHLRGSKGRGLLCLLGVALGVAVFVGIKTAASTATASFQDTVTALAGTADLQVVGQGTGFPEELFPAVAGVRGVRAATPVIEVNAVAAAPIGEPLLVLGVDVFSDREFRRYQFLPSAQSTSAVLSFLTEPHAIALTGAFARRHGLEIGDRLEMVSGARRVVFTVRALLELTGPARALEGNMALVDIATAQEALNRLGKLDRIDLLLEKGAALESVRRELGGMLPADVGVENPGTRLGRMQDMVRAYRLNLLALSLISLFVGLFLIYNASAFSAGTRRYEIAMLRVLGIHRWQVLAMFLMEAIVVGVAGGILGIGIGLILAKTAVKAMAQTISELYLLTRVEHLLLSPAAILLGAGAALGVALLGAFFPSLEASRTLPREALYRGTLERRLRLNLVRLSLAGVLLLAVAYLCSLQPPVAGIPLFGFGAAFLILAGVSFLTPAAVLFTRRVLGPPVAGLFGIAGKMASRYLGRSLSRSAVAIASLMSALAMLMSVSIMILSFRQTVVAWMDQIIAADLYISPAARLTGQRGGLPPELVEALPGLPGVAAIDRILETRIQIDSTLALLDVSDLQVRERLSRIMYREGSSRELLRRSRELDQVSVSEVLATRLGLREGDDLELPTPRGRIRFPIAGVFYDYRTEGGMVLMDRGTFRRFWPDERLYTSVGLYLQPGVDAEQVRSLIRSRLTANQAVFVTGNRELREEILRIFDQTFAITYALQAIAVLVAIFGIVNTLVLLVMERERDIGVLKAVGASTGQIQKMTLVEAGLMGLVSFFLGALTALLLSLLLIFVINRQSFGWTIQVVIPPALFVKTFLLVLACALLAGIIPARAAARKNVSEVMRLE